jgi:membrane-associated phospholipid phosphatase
VSGAGSRSAGTRAGPGLRVSDWAVGGILAVVTVAFAARSLSCAAAGRWAIVHAGLLVAFLVASWATHAFAHGPRYDLALVALKFAILMTLYVTVGVGGLAVFDWGADAALARLDARLAFGKQPSLLFAYMATPLGTEALSLVYAWFIPFLYLSLLSGCVGRPARERERFFDGLALLYALSYLGYLFVAARGPIDYLAEQFPQPLPEGPLHRQVLRSVASTGGNLGAFPSLHVGASLYNCVFDLRRNLLRGLTYVLPVTFIALATLVLRYHYLVDLIAGAALAAVAVRLALRSES